MFLEDIISTIIPYSIQYTWHCSQYSVIIVIVKYPPEAHKNK